MQYLGGKSRIASWIVSNLEAFWTGQPYFEPFVGAAWVMCRFTKPSIRLANDLNRPLITLFKALSNGWEPPATITELEYSQLKSSEDTPLKAFAGFGCSWGGKWFGGYARSGQRNYASNARNSLLKQRPGLANIQWENRDYRTFLPSGYLIYADPPYANTTEYAFKFDTPCFWETMRNWAKFNTVIVSEYIAPPDFECIASLERLQDVRFADGSRRIVTEKLFKHV